MALSVLEALRAAGAKPAHLERAARVWLSGRRLAEHAEREHRPFPAAASALLPVVDRELDDVARVVEAQPAEDGARRLLVELEDGQRVECVELPGDGLCVSTQVGCAVGCGFCATGSLGLTRNLSVVELLAQVAVARRESVVRRVLFMGMGEPAHNLDHVLEAIRWLGLHGDVGHKQLVFSTVGEPGLFRQLLGARVRPALALSLHSTLRGRRETLLPRAPRVEPRALLEAALDYAEASGHPLQLQWTLLRGVNDGDDELRRLIPWLRGRPAVVDFIELNPVEAAGFRPTSRERTHQLTRALHAEGILAKLRTSAGRGARGGCGQLVARPSLP